MNKRAAPEPGPFSRAVRDQLLIEMHNQHMTSLKLASLVPRGKSYLAERFNTDKKDFSLTDVELISKALNLNINDVMQRADATCRHQEV